MDDRPIKSDEEWCRELSPEQYRITRQKGTERPFSGKYNNFKGDGIFRCLCCGNPLFDSKTKFDSGTGWPSFFAPIEDERLGTTLDTSHGMLRTEVTCSRCQSHLGHVFRDGPQPTGLRYCINSASLKFAERGRSEGT